MSQIELLEEHLQTSCSFHPSQRVLLIHLLGRKLQDLFTDAVARQLNIDYLSGLHGPGKLTPAQAASLFWQDRPADMDPGEFERRLGGWLNDLVSIPEGQALLTCGGGCARCLRRRAHPSPHGVQPNVTLVGDLDVACELASLHACAWIW